MSTSVAGMMRTRMGNAPSLRAALADLGITPFSTTALDRYRDEVTCAEYAKHPLAAKHVGQPSRLLELHKLYDKLYGWMFWPTMAMIIAASTSLVFAGKHGYEGWRTPLLAALAASVLAGIACAKLTSSFRSKRRAYARAYDRVPFLVWDRRLIDKHSLIPQEARHLMSLITAKMPGEVVQFHLHSLGPDPWIEADHLMAGGGRDSCVFFIFDGSATEYVRMVEIDGVIVAPPIAA